MGSDDGKGLREWDAVVKRKHSFDALATPSRVPMWDSSDPDRAPPPLPLNPTAASPSLVRPGNTAPGIAAAAQAIVERARENLSPSPYTSNNFSNAMPDSKSPERSLVKGAAHRRLQSLQTNSVKDLRSYLDGSRSTSPERSSRTTTPSPSKDDLHKEDFREERSRSRSATPTPARTTRSNSVRPILGENTPPSATMLALQTMPVKDFPDISIADISNGSMARQSVSIEGLSSQILSLTTICTNLQREMQQLSRRSKDNATDLVSLKEATKYRDEDIRKGLKELKEKVVDKAAISRSDLGFMSPSPGPGGKTFSLPRIPSPSSVFEEGRCGSPNPYSVEGVASVAMLEKIIREMVTKEGQERLLSTLSKLFEKAQKESGQTANKVAELVEFIKSSPNSRALASSNTLPAIEAAKSSALTKTTRAMEPSIAMGYTDASGNAKPYSSPKAADFVSDEIIKLLKKIKDSCGSTAQMLGSVNAEQHNLKGQILGMGRELAEKIDATRNVARGAKAIEDGSGKQDIARIIQEGLAELKVHLENTMREKRRQSNSTVSSKASVDSREVYDVVKRAVAQNQLVPAHAAYSAAAQQQAIDKEAILNAVKEAYEQYKPEFEIQQFGLERDEILQCLKEGLDEYHGNKSPANGITREELHQAIHDAMAHFQPPPPINEAHAIREEVLSAVRECLDEYRDMPPRGGLTGSTLTDRELDMTREVVLDAVRAALASHGPGAPKELEISRDDLFEAVKAGLESSGTPFGRYGEQVVQLINELVQDMRSEFKAYSAAGGRDTEQVLDAMKDGLESLRAEIEQYVDRAQDVTGKDEIIETVRGGLEGLSRDVETYCARPSMDGTLGGHDMIQYMKSEFEHLHRALAGLDGTRGSTRDIGGDKSTIMNALHAGFESLRSGVGGRGLEDDEVQEALRIEFEQLRETILGGHDVHKNEIIDTMQSGFARLYDRLDGGSTFASSGGSGSLAVIREELEQIRMDMASAVARTTITGDRDDIIDAVREKLDDIRTHIITEQSEAARETQNALLEKLESLRDTTSGPVLRFANDDVKDELIETLRNTSDAAAKTLLAEMQSEFEHLRNAVGSSIIRTGSEDQRDELLESIRNATDALQKAAERNNAAPLDGDLLEALRGEFEVLRNTVQTTASRSASKADNEEVLEAVRLGLDDLRSHLEKKMDNPERLSSQTSEMLDALNEGLESLKSDLGKKLDRPFDMTVLYEMQDSLKKGLEDLRRGRKGSASDQALSRGDEMVLVDSEERPRTANTAAAKTPSKPASADVEKIEVMLAELQIKVDSLDQNIQNPVFPPQQPPAEGTVVKEDLTGIEDTIHDIQITIAALSEKLDRDPLAKKDDTDAIETILRNTKAKIEEMQLPDPLTFANTEQFEAMQSLLQATREAIDDLAARVDENNASSKADISVVEAMVAELKASLENIDAQTKPAEKDPEKELSKTDIDAIGVLCLEIKERLNAINNLPTRDTAPSKGDVEQLMGLIHDFRDSHEKLKDSYETDISITAKAFDDRKQEADAIVTGIGMVKALLGEVHSDIKDKLESGVGDFAELKETVKGLEETIAANFSISGDVKELMETINREFDRVHGAVEDAKANQEQKATNLEEKHDTLRDTVIADICTKLDEKFDAIMSKYDDAQQAAEVQARVMEAKAAEQQEIMDTTKDVANELKISLDTLGTTVTGMESSFQEIADKISADSLTVFARMDAGFDRLSDIHTHSAAMEAHHITREEIAKAVGHLETLQSDVTEYHPKFIVRLEEIIDIINQHFEHSRKAQEESKEQARIASEESRSLNEELKNALPGLLPLPASSPSTSSEMVTDSHDSRVHEKLDKLMEQVTSSKESITQLDRLDEIHQKVMATAAEVSSFVNTQTRLITEGHESQKQEAEEMARVLERRLVDKQRVEADILSLQSEKETLLASVNELKAEKEALAAQKARLGADVSSLQTALDIRREELHAMDVRADALERRIIEGIMNQSRILMLAKGGTGGSAPKAQTRTPGSSPNKIRDSIASNSTLGPLPSAGNSSPASKGISLAMRQRPSPVRRSGVSANGNPVARRILSLNQISANAPTGVQGYASKLDQTGMGIVKRSQSVRHPTVVGMARQQGLREVSWNGTGAVKKGLEMPSTIEAEEDKENTDTSLHEIDESADEGDHEHDADLVSNADTTIRTSLASQSEGDRTSLGYASGTASVSGGRRSSGGTVTGTESGWTESGTGSYLTGSDLSTSKRSMSYGSTNRSTLGARTVISEETEEDEGGAEEHDEANEIGEQGDGQVEAEATLGAEQDNAAGEHAAVEEKQLVPFATDVVHTKQMVFHPAPSDSGLGSDLPTAAMSGSEMDYFRRAVEEEAD